MQREKMMEARLCDLQEVNHQATAFLATAARRSLGEVSNMNARRQALRSFRTSLAEMKWLCLQMELVLAEGPTTGRAANDE